MGNGPRNLAEEVTAGILSTCYFGIPLLDAAMFEFLLARVVLSYGVAVAIELVLIGRQALEAHRPARVQFAGADTQLSAKSIAEAIRKSRRGILIDACRVDFVHESPRGFGILRHNRSARRRNPPSQWRPCDASRSG